MCFSYVCHFPIHHNGFHNNGGAGPKAASIMVDGEVANIGETYANMYRIFMYSRGPSKRPTRKAADPRD